MTTLSALTAEQVREIAAAAESERQNSKFGDLRL
jgi:hypothetical protein